MTDDLVVNLTWFEVMLAAQVGMRRRIVSLQRGRLNNHGYDGEDGWTVDVEGAAGEMAAAKAMERYWSGSVNTFLEGGDVSGGVQVRTGMQATHRLIIRPAETDRSIPFVLVTGTCPSFIVRGWILGCDAKREEWLQAPGHRPAAYFVPQAALRSLVELAAPCPLCGTAHLTRG